MIAIPLILNPQPCAGQSVTLERYWFEVVLDGRPNRWTAKLGTWICCVS